MSLPKRLWRIEWEAAVGYLLPTDRRITARNYKDEKVAARQLGVIAAWPAHCKLISVHVTDCDWAELDPAELGGQTDDSDITDEDEDVAGHDQEEA